MKIQIYLLIGLGFLGQSAFALNFDCLSAHGLSIQPEELYAAHGEILESGAVSSVAVTLSDEKDNDSHEVLKVAGPTFPDTKFNPRSERLAGYQKFILEKNKLDVFELYLPTKIQGHDFVAYVKLAFDGSYPNFKQLRCKL